MEDNNVPDTPTIKILANMGACDQALDWAREQGQPCAIQDLWERCTKGHWLLWFLVRIIPSSKSYHDFIARMSARALVEGIRTRGQDDPKVKNLQGAIKEKSIWLDKATPEQLKARILWDMNIMWNAAYPIWGDSLQEEISRWVYDLHQLFPIKIIIDEKKGKLIFKVVK